MKKTKKVKKVVVQPSFEMRRKLFTSAGAARAQATLDNVITRIKEKGLSAAAIDNISEAIENPGLELEAMRTLLKYHFGEILDSLLIDWRNDANSRDTPRRLAEMYVNELFAGRYEVSPRIASFPPVSDSDSDMVLVEGPLKVKSLCSHHWMPIVGHVYIGVLFGKSKVMGLSKYARLVRNVTRRPSIQEQATSMIADALEKALEPRALAVIMEAEHMCMGHRGVEDEGALTTTSVMRGLFRDNLGLRSELYALLNSRKAK